MIGLQEWNSIYEAIRKRIPPPDVHEDVVVVVDEATRSVLTANFASTPILCLDDTHEFTFYSGTPMSPRTVTTRVSMPMVGDTVVIGRISGSNTLRCLGVSKRVNQWQQPTDFRLMGTDLGFVNVAEYGAVGNNDNAYAEINQAAFEVALEKAGEVANLHTLGIVWVPPGAYRTIRNLLIPNGVTMMGCGTQASVILPHNDFEDISLVLNEDNTGTQEFATIESMGFIGGKDYGVELDAVIVMDNFGGNKTLDNVAIGYSDNEGLQVKCTTTGSCGPMVFRDIWVLQCLGHGIVVEAPVVTTRWVGQLKVERQGENKAGIYFKNPSLDTNGNHYIDALYHEQDDPDGHSVWVENTSCVTIMNLRGGPIRLFGSGTGQFGNTGLNLNSVQVYNPTDGVAIYDESNGIEIQGPIVDHYPPFIQEEWIEVGGGGGAPAFNNTWVAFGGGTYEEPSFMKDTNGFVHLRGKAKSGTGGTAIFQLPVGYRPEKALEFTVHEAGGGTGYIAIGGSADGNVYHVLGSTTGISLNVAPFKGV